MYIFKRALRKDTICIFKSNEAYEKYLYTLSKQELVALQRRNDERDNESCVCVPLEDALRGPGHVAWKLIRDIKDNPDNDFEFNEEQILVIALIVWQLEQAWRKLRTWGGPHSSLLGALGRGTAFRVDKEARARIVAPVWLAAKVASHAPWTRFVPKPEGFRSSA